MARKIHRNVSSPLRIPKRDAKSVDRAQPSRDELIELYKVAIEEYRFEVRLNWHRMQYYAVVNSGVVAVGAGLLTGADTPGSVLLAAAVFVIGVVSAAIGIAAIHRGRDYYQATIFKKTLYEELLGLNITHPKFANPKATLAVATTEGMDSVNEILAGRARRRFSDRLFRNRIVSYFMWLLILLAVIDVAAAVYAGIRAGALANPPAQAEDPAARPTYEITIRP